jgi:hypothetical protein
MITTRAWDDFTADELLAAGNIHTKIYGPVHTPNFGEQEQIIFEGLLGGWQRDPDGALSLRRLVQVRDDIRLGVEFGAINAGKWSRVETLDSSIDIEAICEKHDADMAAQAQQQAALAQQQAMNEQAQELARQRAAAQPPLQAVRPELVTPGGNREQRRTTPKR